MKNTSLDFIKWGLTQAGVCLSKSALVNLQGVVNYLKVGRWMADHDFRFDKRVRDRMDVWASFAPKVANRQVLYLEFGVAAGASMRWWSRTLKHPKAILHGFDSFEGLPEDGGCWIKGQFATGGQIPKIDDARVSFFKGWFDQTLPNYTIPPHEVLIVNLDADLYSSTIYVLRWLRPYLAPGTLIYFDEMNHVDHEPKAMDDFVAESGLKFRPICADKTLAFVAFEIVGGEPGKPHRGTTSLDGVVSA